MWSFVQVVAVSLLGAAQPAAISLSDLDLTLMTAGWGKALDGQSIEGKPLRLGGQEYKQGVGTHAPSVMHVELDGACLRFSAAVGVDDEVAGEPGSVRFRVIGDGTVLFNSEVMRPGDLPKRVDLPLIGVKVLTLVVDDAGDGISFDHADWAAARFEYGGSAPKAVTAPREEPYILTPPPRPEPRINGPKVYGVRSGSPFFFTIPATGERPMTFAADGLPEGLSLDAQTGRITGVLSHFGEYRATLIAKNDLGTAEREFRIVAGDLFAITPPMGWNSWYCFFDSVTDEMMRAAADAMVSTGMINHGYSYVNIDDGWSIKPRSKDVKLTGPERDEAGKINPNAKFPDMRALTEYIHSKGLKAGIYTSPGPLTCAGYVATYEHELLDAQRFVEWGFDFLKYDWCSYGKIAKDDSRAELMKPYTIMFDALQKQPKDIVYNLCQYGMGSVWEWGADVGGNCWRTTGDLGWATDLWTNVQNYGFFHHDKAQWNKPGRYNDPDYILIGHIGWQGDLRPTPLTPNEQYLHVSLWSMLAAPLIFSGDMTKLDEFTLSLLTNDEVIEINQDPLCLAAKPVSREDLAEVWAKGMEDGSKAVGLFNRDEVEQKISARWADLGVSGKQRVRDLWRQQDLGVFEEAFVATVPRHGVVLLRLFPAQ